MCKEVNFIFICMGFQHILAPKSHRESTLEGLYRMKSPREPVEVLSAPVLEVSIIAILAIHFQCRYCKVMYLNFPLLSG